MNTLLKNKSTAVLRLFILSTSLFFFSDCKKVGAPMDCFFYSDVDGSTIPLSLFLDEELRGELPNLHTTARIDNDTIISQALHLQLKPGKYKLVARDKNGTLTNEGSIRFSKNSNGITVTRGGTASSGTSGRIVVELTF